METQDQHRLNASAAQQKPRKKTSKAGKSSEVTVDKAPLFLRVRCLRPLLARKLIVNRFSPFPLVSFSESLLTENI